MQLMWRNSIIFRLVLFFALTATLIQCAVSAVIGVQVAAHFRELDSLSLAHMAALAQHTVSAVRDKAGLDELPRHLGAALVGYPRGSVAVIAPDGEILFSTPESAFPPGLIDPQRAAESTKPVDWKRAGSYFRGYSTQASTGIADLPPLTLAVALDIGEHAHFMSTFREILWYSAAASILLTGFLGWFVARRGLAPVRAIAGAAKGISAKRLRDRLPLDEVPTELQDLASSFNDMLARLDDSFQSLSEYSADLAHELRTPISSLTMQTQVALTRARTADEYREILYSNLEEYERLTRMISDMLFIAKADNKLIAPHREQVSLGAEIDDLIDFYHALAEHKGVTIARAGDGRISGDRLMLRRAISNLLSNAMRHVPDGGSIVISVDPERSGGARITVENTGEDVPPEHLPRLFDRFYRADSSRLRNGDGAGLGLAIAKSIVAAHGGELAVSSANGLTRFTITLPPA
jgi:two-component system heavy metal sensor histidine kinase CusS